MEQNDELQGCVFAVPSKTPWITSKPLVHKKNQHSEEYLRMKRIFRENDFSVYTDPETGEIVRSLQLLQISWIPTVTQLMS